MTLMQCYQALHRGGAADGVHGEIHLESLYVADVCLILSSLSCPVFFILGRRGFVWWFSYPDICVTHRQL